jgi:hypothetical protein
MAFLPFNCFIRTLAVERTLGEKALIQAENFGLSKKGFIIVVHFAGTGFSSLN